MGCSSKVTHRACKNGKRKCVLTFGLEPIMTLSYTSNTKKIQLNCANLVVGLIGLIRKHGVLAQKNVYTTPGYTSQSRTVGKKQRSNTL